MGNCIKHWDVYDDPILNRWKPQFDALHMNFAVIGQMVEVFNLVDKNHSRTIDLDEMMIFLEVERTPFRDKVFLQFDSDTSGAIDFREFVLGLWNYCTLTQETIGKCPFYPLCFVLTLLTLFSPPSLSSFLFIIESFTFDMYDKSGEGKLSPRDLEEMLKDLYGKQVKIEPHAVR